MKLIFNIEVCWFSNVMSFIVLRDQELFITHVSEFLAESSLAIMKLLVDSDIQLKESWEVVRDQLWCLVLIHCLGEVVVTKGVLVIGQRMPMLSLSVKLGFKVGHQLVAFLVLPSLLEEVICKHLIEN